MFPFVFGQITNNMLSVRTVGNKHMKADFLHHLDTSEAILRCNMQCFSEHFFELNHQHPRILESYSSADLCFCDATNVCMIECSLNMKHMHR